MEKRSPMLTYFFATVAVASVGSQVARTITDDDVATAAPRDEVIVRKGSTASLQQLCLAISRKADGGIESVNMQPMGAFTQATTLPDGGVETEQVNRATPPCVLERKSEAEKAVRTLVEGAGLSCFRQNLRLEN